LLMFQTVVVYEAIYKVISLAQAIARVWRLRQVRPVKVISLAYEGNLEGAAWPVIARKISWAKSVYGNFVQSSLGGADMDENLDLLSTLKDAITTTSTTAEVQSMPERTLAGIDRQWAIAPDSEIEQAVPAAFDREVAITIDEWLQQHAPTGKQERRSRRRKRVPEAQLVLF